MDIYRINFINQGKVYTLYAEAVRQANLMGFVEIEGLVFGETATRIIDPAEERLKTEFDGVRRCLVPMQAVIRIDQVAKRGQCKITELEGGANVTPFPTLLNPDPTSPKP